MVAAIPIYRPTLARHGIAPTLGAPFARTPLGASIAPPGGMILHSCAFLERVGLAFPVVDAIAALPTFLVLREVIGFFQSPSLGVPLRRARRRPRERRRPAVPASPHRLP